MEIFCSFYITGICHTNIKGHILKTLDMLDVFHKVPLEVLVNLHEELLLSRQKLEFPERTTPEDTPS